MGGAQGGGSKTGLQPWHIIIFVIAAVFILWRGWAYTAERRRASDAKVVAGTEKNPAKPGTKTYQMFEEK